MAQMGSAGTGGGGAGGGRLSRRRRGALGGRDSAAGGARRPGGSPPGFDPSGPVIDEDLLRWAKGELPSAEFCDALPREFPGTPFRSACKTREVGVIDIDMPGNLEKVLEARSFQRELMYAVVTPEWMPEAINLMMHLRTRGWEHLLLVAHDVEVCRELRTLSPVAPCVYSSKWDARWVHPKSASGRRHGPIIRLWALRYYHVAEISKRGTNVLMMDLDMFFMDDPYTHFKGQYANVTALHMSECQPPNEPIHCLNGGLLYVQNAHPKGGVQWTYGEVARRVERVGSDEPMGVWPAKLNLHANPMDQMVLMDSLDSAVEGVETHMRMFWHVPEKFKQEAMAVQEPGRKPRGERINDGFGRFGKGPGWAGGLLAEDLPETEAVGAMLRPLPGNSEGDDGPGEPFVLAPAWLFSNFGYKGWTWYRNGTAMAGNPRRRSICIIHMVGMPDCNGKRISMRALGWWHREVDEMVMRRRYASMHVVKALEHRYPQWEVGTPFNATTPVVALPYPLPPAFDFSTKTAWFVHLRRFMELAHLVGRVPIVPALPCDLGWRLPTTSPPHPAPTDLFTRPAAYHYANPQPDEENRCEMLPFGWYFHCTERLALWAHDLEFLRARHPMEEPVVDLPPGAATADDLRAAFAAVSSAPRVVLRLSSGPIPEVLVAAGAKGGEEDRGVQQLVRENCRPEHGAGLPE